MLETVEAVFTSQMPSCCPTNSLKACSLTVYHLR